MGYNPYRKANGEFATREEAGAQVESDYTAAVASGDEERINEIEDFIVKKMDTTPLGQKVLQKHYGEVGRSRKKKYSYAPRRDSLEAFENREKLLAGKSSEYKYVYMRVYDELKRMSGEQVWREIAYQRDAEAHGEIHYIEYYEVARDDIGIEIPDSMKLNAAYTNYQRGVIDPRFSNEDAIKNIQRIVDNPCPGDDRYVVWLEDSHNPWSKNFEEGELHEIKQKTIAITQERNDLIQKYKDLTEEAYQLLTQSRHTRNPFRKRRLLGQSRLKKEEANVINKKIFNLK